VSVNPAHCDAFSQFQKQYFSEFDSNTLSLVKNKLTGNCFWICRPLALSPTPAH